MRRFLDNVNTPVDGAAEAQRESIGERHDPWLMCLGLSWTFWNATEVTFLILASLTMWGHANAQQPVQPSPVPERLLADLKNTDSFIRLNAANQLGALRARQSVSLLKQAMMDKDPAVREAVVFALGQIADPSAADSIARALSDNVADVKASAAFSLGMLGNPRYGEALSKLLLDENASVRSSAAAALGLLRDDTAADEIIEALNDTSFDVRYDAVWALGRLDAPDAGDHIRAALLNLESLSVDEGSREAFRQVAQNSLDALRRRDGVPAASESSRPRRSAGVVAPSELPRNSPRSDASGGRPLSLRQAVKPAATERALRHRVRGTVGLRVLVDATGRVARAYVTRRLGFGLDQRAMQAVLQYLFDPELKAGLPQSSWLDLEVKF